MSRLPTWRHSRLKFVVTLQTGGTPSVSDPAYWAENGEGIPWVAIADLSREPEVVSTSRWLTPQGVTAARLRVGSPGTLLFAMYASLGAMGTLMVPAAWNQAIVGLRPRIGTDIRFVQYSLMALRPGLSALARSNTQDNLNVEQVGNLPILTGPLDQQRAVADFLDRECDRLAELGAKVSRLAGVVDEQQQGELDAYFASGPESATTRLHRILVERPCYGVLVPRLVASGVPFIRVGDLEELRLDRVAEVGQIPIDQSLEYRRSIVDAGDVLVSVVGSIDKAAVVPKRLAGANVARAVARLRPRAVSSEVLLAWTRTTAYRSQAKLATSADTAQPTLNMGDLANFEISLPLAESARSDLEAAVGRLNKRITSADSTLSRLGDRLSEYRDAVIAEAVSGRLDVTTTSAAQMDERAHEVVESAHPTPVIG